MASASSVQSTAPALTSSLVAPSFATSALSAVVETVIGFGLIASSASSASSASAASLARQLIGFIDLVSRNDLADRIGLDLIGHNGPIGNISLGVIFIGLGFIGFISLVGVIGIIGRILI
jgi:hypothetical protein